jgi:hypothetical protein
MNVSAALLAGLAGAAALVTIELLLPRISRMEVDLVRVVTDEFANRRRREVLAFVTPFVMGSLFAVAYAWFWQRTPLAPTWRSAALLGAPHGFAIIAVSPLVRRIDPTEMFDLPSAPVWMTGEVIDHVIYAVVTARVYEALMLTS